MLMRKCKQIMSAETRLQQRMSVNNFCSEARLQQVYRALQDGLSKNDLCNKKNKLQNLYL